MPIAVRLTAMNGGEGGGQDQQAALTATSARQASGGFPDRDAPPPFRQFMLAILGCQKTRGLRMCVMLPHFADRCNIFLESELCRSVGVGGRNSPVARLNLLHSPGTTGVRLRETWGITGATFTSCSGGVSRRLVP